MTFKHPKQIFLAEFVNLFCAFLKRYVIELTSRQASPVSMNLKQ